jgi:hypothetical protein
MAEAGVKGYDLAAFVPAKTPKPAIDGAGGRAASPGNPGGVKGNRSAMPSDKARLEGERPLGAERPAAARKRNVNSTLVRSISFSRPHDCPCISRALVEFTCSPRFPCRLKGDVRAISAYDPGCAESVSLSNT